MPLTYKIILEIAKDYDFVAHSQRGSHRYFIHRGSKVTIPVKKEFPIGTAKAILNEIAKTQDKTWRDLVEEYGLKL